MPNCKEIYDGKQVISLKVIWSYQSSLTLSHLLSKAETVFKCKGHIVPEKALVGIFMFTTSLLISIYAWHLMRCQQRGPMHPNISGTLSCGCIFKATVSCLFIMYTWFHLLNMYIIYLFSLSCIQEMSLPNHKCNLSTEVSQRLILSS